MVKFTCVVAFTFLGRTVVHASVPGVLTRTEPYVFSPGGGVTHAGMDVYQYLDPQVQ